MNNHHRDRLHTTRRAGVLLHPTALAGRYGPLGEGARWFVDFMADSGLTVWQVLPIGPTHSDHSPYQSLSAHAGNPDFIDLSELAELGLLRPEELHALPETGRHRLLRLAARRFRAGEGRLPRGEYDHFCRSHRRWLEDFVLFCAIRECQGDNSWLHWPAPLRDRHPGAIQDFADSHRDLMEAICFEQFLFHRQWTALRAYASRHGILLFGDIPIFVAHDSADVWANREVFKLDASGQPTAVAGVPPDYFSPRGQHWGNPVYDWDYLRSTGYRWWLERLDSRRRLFDLIRIDHFRGFHACWEIPADNPEPVYGSWVPGPGREFLEACFRKFPDLPLIAENLGVISDEIEQLRRDFHLPGMTVLQFGFDGNPDNPHLLQNHQPEDLVYTGTHDNDTTLGWYRSLDEQTRRYVNEYLHTDGQDMPWPAIAAVMNSVSWLAVVPLQDFLALGSEARFNTPGTTTGNWQWKLDRSLCTRELAERIRTLVSATERLPEGVVNN